MNSDFPNISEYKVEQLQMMQSVILKMHLCPPYGLYLENGCSPMLVQKKMPLQTS